METLERFLRKNLQIGIRQVRIILSSTELRINGQSCDNPKQLISPFCRIEKDGIVLRDRARRVIMVYKPQGLVSATRDHLHSTVLSLIQEPWAPELHFAGRLDRFTTGLVILTNDSRFSEAITQPKSVIGKRYYVETEQEIPREAILEFEKGVWLEKEKIQTHPAQVEWVNDTICRLTIYEGKHHQVKRMFARWNCRVKVLHREAIGNLMLPEDLSSGEWRTLTPAEELEALQRED